MNIEKLIELLEDCRIPIKGKNHQIQSVERLEGGGISIKFEEIKNKQ